MLTIKTPLGTVDFYRLSDGGIGVQVDGQQNLRHLTPEDFMTFFEWLTAGGPWKSYAELEQENERLRAFEIAMHSGETSIVKLKQEVERLTKKLAEAKW